MERRKANFLQKLFSREVHGTFFRGRPATHDKAIKLFGKIPERCFFSMQGMFDSRIDHVLVGTSRCGQFLITYSFSVDHRHPVRMLYKYRLHWWAFRCDAPAHKVAEVQLFDCQDISHPLHVGIAQWPNVNDRLIVYGYNDEYDHQFLDEATMAELDSAVANRNYYITVTTLPSLHNCRDCKAVAESFDEEDMAAVLDSAISFSCLKHGLTIHTTLDVAPPYPVFDPKTSLKMDNKIIVNTGNFLHVLSFALDKEKNLSTEQETILPDEISHRIGDRLSGLRDYICPWNKCGKTSNMGLAHRKSLSTSINNAWLNTIMDRANKVYAFEDSDDGCEPRFKWFKKRRLADKMYEFCSDDEDMENKCPLPKIPRISESQTCGPSGSCKLPDVKAAMMKVERKIIMTDFPMEVHKKIEEKDINKDRLFTHPLSKPEGPLFFKRLSANIFRSDLYNNYDCDNEVPVVTNPPVSVMNKCDNPPVSSTSETMDSLDTNSRFIQTSVTNVSNINSQGTLTCNSHPKSVPSESDHSDNDIPPLDISVINPDLSAILAEWEADSVSSLSPRSDSLSKNDVIQSFLELIPGMTTSPRCSGNSSASGTNENANPKINDNTLTACKMSSPNSSTANKYSPLLVVLRTRNCNQDKEPQKPKEQEDGLKAYSKEEVTSKGKSTKEPDMSLRQRMISGCSVRFDRIYIELDDEIISTISTDCEDDVLEGTGFHCALPLSVHGSAYAQLQMVSSQKAEKLSMNSERVFQSSLDIEQFCFKAADIICQCEGFKFWFCSDYDVEFIDVCALNCDILGVVCMRVNAEKKPPKTENYSKVNQRHFYGIKCVFVWNAVADRCWLEAYSPLVEAGRVGCAREAPARREAERIRNHLNASTLFTLPSYPPIRAIEHRMFALDVLTPSIEEFRDYRNLIGFRLKHYRPFTLRLRPESRHIFEFWG